MPKINVVQPITSIFLSFSIKLVCIKKKAQNITGKDAVKIFKNKSLFFIKLIISL